MQNAPPSARRGLLITLGGAMLLARASEGAAQQAAPSAPTTLPAGTRIVALLRQESCPRGTAGADTVGVVVFPASLSGDTLTRPAVFLRGVARSLVHSTEPGRGADAILIRAEGTSEAGSLAELYIDSPADARGGRCYAVGSRLGGTLNRALPLPRVRHAVPSPPPARSPRDLDDQRRYVPVAGASQPAKVHPSLLWVSFEPASSPAARGMIVALVRGTVVGGIRAADGVDGSYFIRVPADPGGSRIFRDAELLARLPGVASADPVVAIKLHPSY